MSTTVLAHPSLPPTWSMLPHLRTPTGWLKDATQAAIRASSHSVPAGRQLINSCQRERINLAAIRAEVVPAVVSALAGKLPKGIERIEITVQSPDPEIVTRGATISVVLYGATKVN